VQRRGLAPATLAAFGVGYAPAGGQALVQAAREQGLALEVLEGAGLARTNDQGRPYDFFRGRLVIPIRDVQGRVVGFGARRLSDDDPASPKYVNTPETRVFHKGRLVYALERALPAVRKGAHIVLMEGYTDVMAAHQVGLTQCVAVLGTATTEEHAGLIRRSGARRVTLLFDGDEAGRKAAWKALAGLLHLDVKIDVVALGGGQDPCDVLVREGAAPLSAALELACDWFEFACRGLEQLRGAELSRAVDPVLELLNRLAKPVQRESLAQELSRRIGISVGALREQWRLAHPVRHQAPPAPQAPIHRSAEPPRGSDPRLREAHEDLLGALLLDASLLPMARAARASCPDPELAAIGEVLLALFADEAPRSTRPACWPPWPTTRRARASCRWPSARAWRNRRACCSKARCASCSSTRSSSSARCSRRACARPRPCPV
jgi:DNA primase